MPLFEMFLEMYRQCTLDVAAMSTIDRHHRFSMAEELIKTWLQAPDALVSLRRCHHLAVAARFRTTDN